ncbi:MAG: hypothetical protein ABIH39_05215 [Candidatus Margulisiibacteriota bacterium]
MKYEELRKLIKGPYFSRNDILFSDKTIYDYQLNYWVNKGYLTRLKNGIYAFADSLEKINGEEISTLLYSPSYISLETALSYYGIIPEMVFSYTSVTTKTNRAFKNKLGNYIYRHIKKTLFWGYLEKGEGERKCLFAEPEKAVLDYVYLNISRINNEHDFLNLRFNMEKINEVISKEKLAKYLKAFEVKKMERTIKDCLL